MNAQDSLKSQHLLAESRRWDEAIASVQRLLNYDGDPLIGKLTERLLSVSGQVRYTVLGGHLGADSSLSGYRIPYSPIEVLEFVSFFVSHEILDDGEPGIGYMRFDRMVGGNVLCDPSHEEATPFFHKSVDFLREKQPKAKWLNAERALQVLEIHAARDEEVCAYFARLCPEDKHGPSEEELLLGALAKELKKDQ